jgi:hypothetical protein
MSTGQDKPPLKKRGPKSGFSQSLGLTVFDSMRLPAPIWELLRQKSVRRLLNWMASNDKFQDKILDQVPETDPE